MARSLFLDVAGQQLFVPLCVLDWGALQNLLHSQLALQ